MEWQELYTCKTTTSLAKIKLLLTWKYTIIWHWQKPIKTIFWLRQKISYNDRRKFQIGAKCHLRLDFLDRRLATEGMGSSLVLPESKGHYINSFHIASCTEIISFAIQDNSGTHCSQNLGYSVQNSNSWFDGQRNQVYEYSLLVSMELFKYDKFNYQVVPPSN